RATGGDAVGGREVDGHRLPARARPVEVVRGAPQGEGGAVGVDARPAPVVGHAATKSRGHGGGAERAADGRGGDRGRGRRRAVEREAGGRAGARGGGPVGG